MCSAVGMGIGASGSVVGMGSGASGSPCHCVLHWPTKTWSDEGDTPVHCSDKTFYAALLVNGLDSHTQEESI